MLPPLPDRAVRLGAVVGDWRAAVRASGEALKQSGATTGDYTGRMIAMIEEYGPYIVIAPGLALAHARPGADVRRTGMSVVTLAHPVAFGHAHNDPVDIVIGLAVTSADAHVGAVAALANVFNDPSVIPAIRQAADADTVRELLGASA